VRAGALPILALLAVAAAAEHTVVELHCPEKVSYRVLRDLDGDGLDDLALVTNREALYWRGRRGAFPKDADVIWRLPEGTALFDVGPPGAARQRLVARTATAYWALNPDGRSERLAHASGPGLPMRPANILWRGFFGDFDRDGKGDFIDVSLYGYTIAFGGGGSVMVPPRLAETVDTRVNAASERLVARYGLGNWTAGDFNGDGLGDFAVMTRNGLEVYPGDEKGRFNPAYVIGVTLEEALDAELTFADFNGDGKTDVLAIRHAAGKASVTMADSKRGLLEPHRIRLAVPGHLRHPVAADLDGDGAPDLALPYTAKPSIQAGVRVVMRGEAILKVPIFRNRGGGTPFGARADRQISFPIRLRVSTDKAGRFLLGGLVIVEYSGDVTGDGRSDLLITAQPALLNVHRGIEGEIFEEEPSATLGIPDCSAYDSVLSAAANLNGDDRSDIILLYRGSDRLADRLYLLLSRKK
jgi:hypothetical protein